MKFISVIVLCIGLSGCFYQTVNENDIRSAEKVCNGRDNLLEISAYMEGIEYATCRDGNIIKLNKGN